MMLRSLVSHIPSITNMVKGMETTALILRLKWRTVRDIKARIFLFIGLGVLLVSVFFSAHLGSLIREIAQSGRDDAAQQFALVYLQTFSRGELGTIGASLLGLSVLSAIVTPFTGAIRTSIMSTQEMVAFPLTRWHRFVDSFVSQVFSSISVLQLVALTGISSLLTLQGGKGISMLFTWAVWLNLVILSVLSIWAADAMFRRFGKKVRWTILGITVSVIGIAILIDPNNGKTLFGVGTAYANIVQNVGTTFTTLEVMRAFAVVAGLGFTLLIMAASLSSLALSTPERTPSRVETKKKFLHHKRFLKASSSPEQELIRFFLLSIFRASESRKPIVAAVLLGAGFLIASEGDTTIVNTFTVLVPLVAALAWGVNAFGAIGGGTVWLASQPRIFNRLPWLFFATQSIITVMLFISVWLPGVLLGRVDLDILPSALLGAISVTALVARSSVSKSVYHPHATRFGVRGETLLPPMTTLNYTFRFSLWAGQYGVLVIAANDLVVQLGLAFLAIVWSAFRMTRLHDKWTNDPKIRGEVFATVAQD